MDRKGVLLLFFDLPMDDRHKRKTYTNFRRALKCGGYIQIQRSVYAKLLYNRSNWKTEVIPFRTYDLKGSVFVLPLPLIQFRKMTEISGKKFDFSMFSDNIIYI